jgi:Iap family predicted aminopeptidase
MVLLPRRDDVSDVAAAISIWHDHWFEGYQANGAATAGTVGVRREMVRQEISMGMSLLTSNETPRGNDQVGVFRCSNQGFQGCVDSFLF